MVRRRTVLTMAFAAALVVFASVQDRVTASGARQYVALQRVALAGTVEPVTIEDVMAPAIRRSVQEGLTWSVAVVVGGAALSWFLVPGSGRE